METNRPEMPVSSGALGLEEETVSAAIATAAPRMARSLLLLLLLLSRIRLLPERRPDRTSSACYGVMGLTVITLSSMGLAWSSTVASINTVVSAGTRGAFG